MREKTKLLKKIIELGYTYSKIAEKLTNFGVTPTTVFQWADGRRIPSARLKKALAKIFDCKVSDIF